jgi:hypothetical protein
MFGKLSTARAARVLLATAIIAASGIAAAEDVKVSLTGAEEVPAVTTAATGSGTISIAKDYTVSGSVKTAGLEGTAAHIHAAAVGQSGPPVITLAKGEAGVWTVPGGSKLTPEQYEAFKAGNLYVNVHSAAHKPGEIRGQLKP